MEPEVAPQSKNSTLDNNSGLVKREREPGTGREGEQFSNSIGDLVCLINPGSREGQADPTGPIERQDPGEGNQFIAPSRLEKA